MILQSTHTKEFTMYDKSKQNMSKNTARIDYITALAVEKLQPLSSAVQIEASSHLFGVAQSAALLAGMRGEDIELAYIAGLLHDLYKFTTSDVYEHAEKGAAYAKPLLERSGLFTSKEIETICGAIYFHSTKDKRHLPFDEILKDADVMQSVLASGAMVVSRKQDARWKALRKEFSFKD